MISAKWLFIVLCFWLLATFWCNALEPGKTEFLPSDITSSIRSMSDEKLASTDAISRLADWLGALWKALSFDYAIFEGWLAILRYICIIFSVAGIYFICDLIYQIIKLAGALVGKFG